MRRYRSSSGWEFFITVEGGNRGSGGGSTMRSMKKRKLLEDALDEISDATPDESVLFIII